MLNNIIKIVRNYTSDQTASSFSVIKFGKRLKYVYSNISYNMINASSI
jgi:hypothetical protein